MRGIDRPQLFEGKTCQYGGVLGSAPADRRSHLVHVLLIHIGCPTKGALNVLAIRPHWPGTILPLTVTLHPHTRCLSFAPKSRRALGQSVPGLWRFEKMLTAHLRRLELYRAVHLRLLLLLLLDLQRLLCVSLCRRHVL